MAADWNFKPLQTDGGGLFALAFNRAGVFVRLVVFFDGLTLFGSGSATIDRAIARMSVALASTLRPIFVVAAVISFIQKATAPIVT